MKQIARKKLLTFIALLLVVASGGCMRIGYEFETQHFMAPNPHDTFFPGTKECFETNRFFPGLGYILLPGELVGDVIFIPLELFKMACYEIAPPLTEYINENDMEGLEKNSKGAQTRTPSRRAAISFLG